LSTQTGSSSVTQTVTCAPPETPVTSTPPLSTQTGSSSVTQTATSSTKGSITSMLGTVFPPQSETLDFPPATEEEIEIIVAKLDGDDDFLIKLTDFEQRQYLGHWNTLAQLGDGMAENIYERLLNLRRTGKVVPTTSRKDIKTSKGRAALASAQSAQVNIFATQIFSSRTRSGVTTQQTGTSKYFII